MENEITGIAIEDIKAGQTIIYNPRNGQVRIANTGKDGNNKD